MTMKADKTFEEIVERLVALFRGQHEGGVIEVSGRRSSAESPADSSAASSLPVPLQDDAAS